MSEQMDALAQQVSQNTTVVESAIALINGFSQRLSDGIAAAQAGDLSKLTDLQTELATEDQKLAAAVAQNTPSAPTSSAAATPPSDAGTVASDTASPSASAADAGQAAATTDQAASTSATAGAQASGT